MKCKRCGGELTIDAYKPLSTNSSYPYSYERYLYFGICKRCFIPYTWEREYILDTMREDNLKEVK